MTAEKKTVLLKILLGAAIMAYPIIGYFWILAGITDFLRVRSFKRPIFCILSGDGASGTYAGFCYSFEIEGNFMPEDELPGVAAYTARILNTPVMAGVRD